MQTNTEILVQGSPEWFAARCGRFTSSEYWKLTVQPKTKKDREAGKLSATTENYLLEKLQERLTGEVKDQKEFRQAEWGHMNEPLARERYAYLTGRWVEETGFTQYGNNAGGSPDGLVDFDGILEIKCPSAEYLKRALENPAHNRAYYAQIQMNLLITGRDWCDYVVFDPRMPDDIGITIQRIMADHAMQEEIRTTLNWAEEQMDKLEKDLRDKIANNHKSFQI